MKRIFLFIAVFVSYNGIAKADEVDEAAKCAATFRILTSLQVENEQLGQHFTKLGLFSVDLTGLYSKSLRNRSMTNGQVSELITYYQLELDALSSDGSAFLPYVRSCMGWLATVGTVLNDADLDRSNIRKLLISAPTPSMSFEYPHSDWPTMQNLFLKSYEIWGEMGKLTPRDYRKALGID